MLTMTVDEFSAEAVVDEMLDGGGAVRLTGLYSDGTGSGGTYSAVR